MKNILYAYGIPTSIVEEFIILYRDTISMVRSPVEDTPYFEITAEVLQGDTRAPFLFYNMSRLCLEKIDDNKHLGLTLKKRMSIRHPAIYITDTDDILQ